MRQTGQHLGMAETGNNVQFQRDDIRRQTPAEASGEADHLGPVRVMNQQAWRGAARLAIGPRQDLHARQEGGKRGVFIGDRGRGAQRRTGAATCTHHRIDGHVIARRCDRPGRTDIEAIRTAGLFGPRMGAQAFVQPDIERFFECPGQLRGLKRQAFDRQPVARIGAQIPFAFLPGRNHGCAAGKVDHDITL